MDLNGLGQTVYTTMAPATHRKKVECTVDLKATDTRVPGSKGWEWQLLENSLHFFFSKWQKKNEGEEDLV